MNRQQFFFKLNSGLKVLPRSERKEILKYYNEIFDDKVEEGLSEEEIIRQLGPLDEIIANSLNYCKSDDDTENGSKSDNKYIRVDDDYLKTQKRKDFRKTIIIVAACTFYIWLPLILGLGAGLFGIIIGIGAAAFSFVVSGFACVLAGGVATAVSIYTLFTNFTLGLCSLGASLCSIGIGLIILWVSRYVYYILKALVISLNSKLRERSKKV